MQRRVNQRPATVSAAAHAVNTLWQDHGLLGCLDTGALAALTAVLCGFQGQEVVTVARGADAAAAARAYDFAGIAAGVPTLQLRSGISAERHAHYYALGHHYATAEAQLASRLGVRLQPLSGPRGVLESPSPGRWEPSSAPAHIGAGASGCTDEAPAGVNGSAQAAGSSVKLQQLADIIAVGAHGNVSGDPADVARQLTALFISPAAGAVSAQPAGTAVEAAGLFSLQGQPPADKMQADGCSGDLGSSSSSSSGGSSSGGSEAIPTAALPLAEPECGLDGNDDAASGFWSCGSAAEDGDDDDAAAVGQECWGGDTSDDDGSDVANDWASMCSDDGAD